MPVVCMRLSQEALERLEEKARRKGTDRSGLLRSMVLKDLGLGQASTEVEALPTPPPQTIDVLVPGDELHVIDPPDPNLPPGAIRP